MPEINTTTEKPSPCGHADQSWRCATCSIAARKDVWHCTVCLVESPQAEMNVYRAPAPTPPVRTPASDEYCENVAHTWADGYCRKDGKKVRPLPPVDTSCPPADAWGFGTKR